MALSLWCLAIPRRLISMKLAFFPTCRWVRAKSSIMFWMFLRGVEEGVESVVSSPADFDSAGVLGTGNSRYQGFRHRLQHQATCKI